MNFRHAGIVTQNIEELILFYKNALGFSIKKDVLETGEFVSSICGLSNIKVRTVKMSLNDNIVLELLDFKNVDNSCNSERNITDKGYTHMALTVSNLDKLYSSMLKEGVHFTTKPLISPDGNAKVTFCKDPDGNLLELVEELK